jgi:hypothetical protein
MGGGCWGGSRTAPTKDLGGVVHINKSRIMTVNCVVECANGCILGDQCSHRQYLQQATQFVENTSLDQMLEMADEARRKKMTAPPQWILPEDN